MLTRMLAASLFLTVTATHAVDPRTKSFACSLSPIFYGLPDGFPPETGMYAWWYVNADRTLWAAGASMQTGGNKVPWIRPKGSELQITARRLDAVSSPATVEIPCCYDGRFQVSGLSFPTAGYWEVSAKADSSELTFVTLVQYRPSETSDGP